jgi:ABC-type Fe3+ transport system permease subunit
MAGLRGFRAMWRLLLRFVLVAPLVALLLSVLVDRGSAGELRLSRFPLALLAVDSLVPTCTRNSVVFAVTLCVCSLGLGIAVGWLLARRSFWGRPLWRGAVLGLLGASPAVLALGIIGVAGPARPWPWPLSSRGPAESGVSLESWAGLGLWLVWLWSSLPAATALVAAVTASAIERLEPSWEEAARLAGASPFRSWSMVIWPLIRPPVARAAALVFALGLLEPGAPLILGLRRTLAFQIVAAASQSEPFPAISAWCMVTGLIALAGVVALRRLGGTPILAKAPSNGSFRQADSDKRPASPIRAAASSAILAAWCSFAWMPVIGLVQLAVGSDSRSGSEGPKAGGRGVLVSCLGDPLVRRLAVNSAQVGLEVSCATVVLFWLSGLGRRPRGGLARSDGTRPPSPIVFAPPLIVGVGVLAIPRLIEAAAGWLRPGAGGGGIAHSLSLVADVLAPNGNPSLFLPVSITWAVGPLLFVCWNMTPPGPRAARAAIDAARLAGASRVGALWLGAPGLVATWLGRFALAWALAATSLGPALLASPGSDGPTVAPGFVILAEGNPNARGLAADLALGILLLSVAALSLAWVLGALPRLEDCDPP